LSECLQRSVLPWSGVCRTVRFSEWVCALSTRAGRVEQSIERSIRSS
jgi:hypothetical protein